VTQSPTDSCVPPSRGYLNLEVVDMRFANVGSVDRILRILIGAALAALPFLRAGLDPSTAAGIASMAVGGVLIVTALIKFCPIYGLFGLRTRSRD